MLAMFLQNMDMFKVHSFMLQLYESKGFHFNLTLRFRHKPCPALGNIIIKHHRETSCTDTYQYSYFV